jgi:acetylornithine deacetylase/succinyl-diaminopimelate desuccinylase-like protein
MLEETTRIAQDLMRIDTTNFGEGRSNGETEAAEYLGALLEKLDLATTYVDAAPHRTSVFARLSGSDPNLPALVIHGHTDVVPAEPKNWTVDPFGGEIRDGMLWGRGAVDMKNMDAMMIGALTDILADGGQPRRDLIIGFFSDEENGGVFGSHYVVDNHPEIFAGATEAISEVGGYSVTMNGTRAYLLQTGEKALIWVKLIAHGTAAHGSRVIHANAVTMLAEAVVALGRRDWPVHLTDTTEELVGELARIMEVDVNQVDPEEIVLSTGNAAGFIQASLRTTTNPTVLTAGYKHNVIPDSAEALIDIRCLAGEEDEVLAEVRALIGPHIELEILHQDIGLENRFAGPLVDAMVGSLQKADPGAPVLPYLLSGGTDNKALAKLGITGYGFAPLQLPADLDFPAMFHGVDERVPLDALVFGRRVLGDLLSHY